MNRILIFMFVATVALSGCSRTVSQHKNGALHNGEVADQLVPYAGNRIDVSMKSQKGMHTDIKQGSANYGARYDEAEVPELLYTGLVYQPDTTNTEDTTEVEPALHPLVISGAALTGAAVITGIVVALGPVGLFFVPLGMLVLGVVLTTMGLKRVKLDPEIWRGEKLAMLVYYSLIPIGLFLMLLPVWLLFNV